MGNLNEVYRKIMEEEGLTQEQAAKLLGYVGQGSISRKLVYGISLNAVLDLAESIGGYRLVLEKVKPNGKVKERYELKK